MNFPDALPFVQLHRDAHRTIMLNGKKRRVRILIHGAYSAGGLIGTEHNGVGIADEGAKQVICSAMAAEPAGTDLPTPAQLTLFDKLTTCTDAEFLDAVRAHHNNRGTLS